MLAVGLGYFAAAQFAVSFAVMQSGVAVMWLPNAVVLAALLRTRPCRWWLYCLPVIPAELLADIPVFSPAQALGFALVNLIEVLIAAGLLRRLAGGPFMLEGLRQVLGFGVVCMVIAPATAALAGAAIYHYTVVDDLPYWVHWHVWWFGDGLGLLVLTPMLLWWLQPPTDRQPYQTTGRFWPEGLIVGLLFAGLGGVLFWPARTLESSWHISPALILPGLIWLAVRFGIRSVSLVGGVMATVAIIGLTHGRGPFVMLPPQNVTIVLQEFIAAMLLTGLSIAALVQELRAKNSELKLFKRAVESIEEGVVIADARQVDHPLVYANPKFESITGYSAKDIQGKNCRFLAGTDRDQPALVQVRQALAAQEPVCTTLRNYRKDGRMFWNRLLLSPVTNENGVVTHFVGIQSDITSIKETEDSLRQAHEAQAELNRELEARVAQRTKELETLATTDALTGAYNRRYLQDRAAIEIAQAQRHGQGLAMMMMDLDHFKRVNDGHGHAVGDTVLQHMCAAIRRELRPADVFARFGGEEFVLLLPQTSPAMTRKVAERLRSLVEELRIDGPNGLQVRVTISIGVAPWGGQLRDFDALLKASDAAMYRAKAAGRNRVMYWEDGDSAP